jgi:hypothetical protein
MKKDAKVSKLTLTRESIKTMRTRTNVRSGMAPGGPGCGPDTFPQYSTQCASAGCLVYRVAATLLCTR